MSAKKVALLFCGALLFAQTPATVPDLEALARKRIAAGDGEGALAAYQKLIGLVPKSAVYQDQAGFVLAATERSTEAIPYFQRATKLDPKMAQAWYHLGVAEWLGKQADPAASALQKAVTLDPGNWDYRFRLGTVYNETGRYAEAVRELVVAARIMGTNAKVQQTLAIAYERQHLFKPARDAYQKAVQLDPKNTAVRNGLGNALVRSGDPAAGLREFRRILESDPNNVSVQVNIGYAYIAAGDNQAAIKQLTSVIRNHPDDAGAHYDLGIAYKAVDDLPHARAELEQAVHLEPSLAEAHYSLALTDIDAGVSDQAIEQLRAAVAQRPEYNDAWYILGTTLKQQGDVDGAIEALRHSVALDDLNAAAWNNLGLLLRRKGDKTGAEDAFAKAAAIRKSEEEEKEKKLQQGVKK